MGAAFVVQFLVTFFWMPESAFDRVGAIYIDTGEQSVVVEKVKKIEAEHVEDSTSTASPATEAKKSYLRELLPYSGYWAKVSFWRTFLQPFAMMASPVVLWATILFTTCISWLVLISVTLSQIFSAPPYNFSVAAVGASNLSSFVATLIATGLAGPIIDGCIQFMSKRNKGVFGKSLSL